MDEIVLFSVCKVMNFNAVNDPRVAHVNTQLLSVNILNLVEST